jgi:hypothetical protein
MSFHNLATHAAALLKKQNLNCEYITHILQDEKPTAIYVGEASALGFEETIKQASIESPHITSAYEDFGVRCFAVKGLAMFSELADLPKIKNFVLLIPDVDKREWCIR